MDIEELYKGISTIEAEARNIGDKDYAQAIQDAYSNHMIQACYDIMNKRIIELETEILRISNKYPFISIFKSEQYKP